MQRPLSAKLSFWIVLAAALLFFVMILYLVRVWRSGVGEEVDKDAEQVLENAVFHLDDILEDAEWTTSVLAWFVDRDLDRPDMMIPHATNTLRYNTTLNSCSISFEPWFYPKKGEYYSIFSWHGPDGKIEWEQEGDDTYRYFEKEWYQLSKNLGYDCWTKPYLDDTNAPGLDSEMYISYCNPIFKDNSIFVGVITLDLSVKRLSETLYNVKPYENAYCIMLDEDGEYLVHPDADKLMSHSIFTEAEDLSLPALAELGEAMGRQEKGKKTFTMDG